MSEQAFDYSAASRDDDAAEWRPYQVWASQMRSADSVPHANAGVADDGAGDSWDPYTVWKQQVQQNGSQSSGD